MIGSFLEPIMLARPTKQTTSQNISH